MSFCTAVNCMDGRVQLPVVLDLQERFGVEYVDMVTEPGPNLILAKQSPASSVDSILARIRVSVEQHQSVGIVVIGHYDCAGNPGNRVEQNADTLAAVEFLREQFPDVPIIGMWFDENWTGSEINKSA